MPAELTQFIQDGFATSAEVAEVTSIAVALLEHMNTSEVQMRIARANAPGQSSAGIQEVLLPYLTGLGFKDESKGLFASYHTPAVRPDFFKSIEKTGILLEVERGKTTINNMDFLDFWKCHLCEHANYLFLIVPRELRQNEASEGRLTRPYNAVVKRLHSFFLPRNYTNVRGLFIFGY